MSFITYLITGLSIAASPGHPGVRSEASVLRVQSAEVSGERTGPAAVVTPRDPVETDRTARPQARAMDPDRHAKAQKHYDPSHKEAAEIRAGRSQKAQRKRSATARQRPTTNELNGAGNRDATAPAADSNRPK